MGKISILKVQSHIRKAQREYRMVDIENAKIGIIGLGYVGLPLAVEFGKKFDTVGYDLSNDRVDELRKFHDSTQELSSSDIKRAIKLGITNEVSQLLSCNVYIITVPTPILESKSPDMSFLKNACQFVGKVIANGDVIIFESTVYPGATEDFCVPFIEMTSRKTFNTDFFVGYSPERINPGDKNHRLTDIVKITSGSTSDTSEFIDELYKKIISAGTHRASSIKVAEAAKVIENTQRDLNIGLINELTRIFEKMNLDTNEVLDAACTKWNFLDFRPGLVGGHCIGVDPYYLTYKAKEIGVEPGLILAGRQSNEMMASYFCELLLSELQKHGVLRKKPRILQLGITFKENCPDIRNSKSVDMLEILSKVSLVDLYDPWVEKFDVPENGKFLTSLDNLAEFYDAVIVTVAHKQFLGNVRLNELTETSTVRMDIKNIMPKSWSTKRI
jgi:UDP-N-acetyl-D-glucosamine/UDP-N-acetyl-D-galactosamine dehydrogenase